MCIRYVVSYPRLSRMTRRKGTGYLRFWALAGAALRAGDLAATRRGAAARVFEVRAFAAGVGATRRAAVFAALAGGADALAARAGCCSRVRAGFGSAVVRDRGSGAAGVVR